MHMATFLPLKVKFSKLINRTVWLKYKTKYTQTHQYEYKMKNMVSIYISSQVPTQLTETFSITSVYIQLI